jgi:serine/threonine protein kinase
VSSTGAYLHERDALHRDLKCSNVLVDQRFRCKIADFGLSRVIDQKHTKVWFPAFVRWSTVQNQRAHSSAALLAAGPTAATCCQAMKNMGPMGKSMISAADGNERAANHARPKLKRQLTRK